MNSVIETLKTNENPHRIFADMTPEEQACLRRVGPQNLRILVSSTQGPFWVDNGGSPIQLHRVYSIKPDYQPQPEPETVDLEIEEYESGMWLGVYSDHRGIPHHFTNLHELSSLPGFLGFYKYKEDGSECRTFIDYVSEEVGSGRKVIARFER